MLMIYYSGSSEFRDKKTGGHEGRLHMVEYDIRPITKSPR